MATINFDELQAGVDKAFAHLDVPFGDGDGVHFVNAFQLDTEARKELAGFADRLSEEGVDEVKLFGDIFRHVASDKDACERFLAKVGDNVAFLLHVFNVYEGETEAGEA